jgi:endoglucanase
MWSLLLLLIATPVFSQLSLPHPAFSPPIASSGAQPSSGYPNPQWSTLLGNLLYFFEAQRSGNLSRTSRVSWRNSSALDDEKDAGLDLSEHSPMQTPLAVPHSRI